MSNTKYTPASAAYAVEVDFSFLGDNTHLAEILPFANSNELNSLVTTEQLPVPVPVWFEGDISACRSLDYVENSEFWPLMSLTLYDKLQALGTFPCRAIRSCIVDDRIPPKERFTPKGLLKDGVDSLEYVGVQLLDYTDALDRLQSDVTAAEGMPGLIISIGRFVFRNVALPSLFRLKEAPDILWASQAAAQEMVRCNAKGVVLVPAEDVTF